jgi:hypothetical protein
MGHSERETQGGCDATLGIGILYLGANCSGAWLHRNCGGCGRNRKDHLLYLPGSFSCIACRPSPAPSLRERLSRCLYRRSKAEQISTREWGGTMNGRTILGIALVVIGLFALAYQGFTYTTQKKVVDIGPIQATKEEHHTVPLPPILGAVALVAGIVVVVSGQRGN